MKVLCVADDRRVAYLMRHVLAFEGYAVEFARADDGALEVLADGVGLIVSTVPLPDVDVPVVVVAPPVEPDALLAALRQVTAREAATAHAPLAVPPVTGPSAGALETAGTL